MARLTLSKQLLKSIPTFVRSPNWPEPLPNGWQIGPVNGVALDANGHIWVSNFVGVPPAGTYMAVLIGNRPKETLPPPILEFDQAGKLLRAWGGPGDGFDWPLLPHGLATDHKGYIWICGTYKGQDSQVLKFTPDGEFVMQIGRPGSSGGALSTDQLGRPSNVCIDPETNEIYIADGYGNRRIIVFDAETGAFKRMWGAYGKPPVEPSPDVLDNFYNSDPVDPAAPPPRHFNSPVHCVMLSNDGLIYVCDRSHSRIQIFQKDGTYVQEFFFDKGPDGTSGQATHVAFWPDEHQTYLIVGLLTDIFQILVVRRDTGEILSRSGTSDEIEMLHMFDIDAEGNLYTGEVGGRIQKWEPVPSGSVPEPTNIPGARATVTSCC